MYLTNIVDNEQTNLNYILSYKICQPHEFELFEQAISWKSFSGASFHDQLAYQATQKHTRISKKN